MRMHRYLVTGSSGFIGTNLIDHLLRAGLNVLGVDIKEPQNVRHQEVFRHVDVLNQDTLTQTIIQFRPTHVVHMAAKTDFARATLEDYQVNFKGVRSLIDALAQCDSVQRCLFMSSKLVCRTGYQPHSWEDYNPDTVYGQSKVEGETIIRSSSSPKCEWLIARPTSIWGPWFGIPYRPFFLAVAKGRYFHPGRANPSKSYGYVGNTVHQIMKLMGAPREAVQGKTFYLSDYEPYTIRDWANMISRRLSGKEASTIPEAAVRIVAWAGDCLQTLGWKNPPMTSFRLGNMRTDTTIGVSMAPTEGICGALPYSMEQGVVETIQWLRTQQIIA